MAIQIKEGRYYKDGFGNVGGPAERRECDVYPWIIPFKFGSLRQYTCDGKFSIRGQRTWDLVSECDKDGNPIKDEAMTEAPKLDPVTITQGMVNHAIQDLVSKDKYADVERLVTAWSDVRRIVK